MGVFWRKLWNNWRTIGWDENNFFAVEFLDGFDGSAENGTQFSFRVNTINGQALYDLTGVYYQGSQLLPDEDGIYTAKVSPDGHISFNWSAAFRTLEDAQNFVGREVLLAGRTSQVQVEEIEGAEGYKMYHFILSDAFGDNPVSYAVSVQVSDKYANILGLVQGNGLVMVRALPVDIEGQIVLEDVLLYSGWTSHGVGTEEEPYSIEAFDDYASYLDYIGRQGMSNECYVYGTIREIDENTGKIRFETEYGDDWYIDADRVRNLNGQAYGLTRQIPAIPYQVGDQVLLRGYAQFEGFDGGVEYNDMTLLKVNGEAIPAIEITPLPETVEHAGTEEDPYSAVDAMVIASGFDANYSTATEDFYFIEMTVDTNPTADYANFHSIDGTNSLLVYGICNANGVSRYGAKREIAEIPFQKGQTVIVKAQIQNYYGGLQLKNAILISVDGEAIPAVAIPRPEVEEGHTVSDLYLPEVNAIKVGNFVYTNVAYGVRVEVVALGNQSDGSAPADQYGNMWVKDKEGNIYMVYGSSASESIFQWDEANGYFYAKNPKDYLVNEMTAAIQVGDILDCVAIRSDYKGKQEIILNIRGVVQEEPFANSGLPVDFDFSSIEQEDIYFVVWSPENQKDAVRNAIASFASDLADAGYQGTLTYNVYSMDTYDAARKMIADPEYGADIYFFYQDQLQPLNSAGVLGEIPEALQNWIYATQTATAVNAATLDNTLMAYPATTHNGYFLYYDKSVLSEEDVMDWERIIEVAQTGNYEIDFNYANGWYSFGFFYGAGADSQWYTDEAGNFVSYYDTYNSAQGLVAARALSNLLSYDGVVDNASVGGAGENCIAIVDGIWDYNSALAKWGDNLGCVELPHFTVNGVRYHMGSFLGGNLVGVKPQETLARSVILNMLGAYLNNYDSQAARFVGDSGVLPSNQALAESEEVASQPVLAALSAQSDYAKPQGWFPGNWWNFACSLAMQIRELGPNPTDAQLHQVLEDYASYLDQMLDA